MFLRFTNLFIIIVKITVEEYRNHQLNEPVVVVAAAVVVVGAAVVVVGAAVQIKFDKLSNYHNY